MVAGGISRLLISKREEEKEKKFMQTLEIIFQNVEETEEIKSLIRQRASKLNQVFKGITSCHVTVERLGEQQESGSNYHVRIELDVLGTHLVILKESARQGKADLLNKVVQGAFNVAHRQLEDYVKKQREERRKIPEKRNMATVVKLFRDDGYGFVKTAEGREIFFNRKSVLYDEFDHLEIGSAVLYEEEEGEKGIQARKIEIIGHME